MGWRDVACGSPEAFVCINRLTWPFLLLEPINFFPFFWLHCELCGILVPWPKTETALLALDSRHLNHWTAGEVSKSHLLIKPVCWAWVCNHDIQWYIYIYISLYMVIKSQVLSHHFIFTSLFKSVSLFLCRKIELSICAWHIRNSPGSQAQIWILVLSFISLGQIG